MPEVVWYRSLYWRIAFGFVALLAALLVIQAGLSLWLTLIVGRSALSPSQLAHQVAIEIAQALERNPNLPIESYVREQFGHIYQPFVVAMHDGRTASNQPQGLPRGFGRIVQGRGRRMAAESRPPDAARREPAPAGDERQPGGAPPVPEAGRGETGRADVRPEPGRPEPGRRLAEFAPIVVHNVEVGTVAVPGNPPPAFVPLRQLGPTLAWVAVGLLAVGSAVMALLIFRPAQKRLRTLEQAARALGEGRTDVRAAEGGGDEVSSLSRTFNRMAEDLSARAAALAASDNARRQLLADVSHELMTPLAAIRGYTETLAMPGIPLDEPTRQRYLDIIGEETQKLEAVIGDLLDLARLEGGGGSWATRRIRVRDLFDRVRDRHGLTVGERNITVDIIVEPEDLTVAGDPQRLEQAVQNLAANALRHTPDGGRVELRGEAQDDQVRIVVRDTGPGIPQEHLTRVFDRFYKVDSSRTSTAPPSGSGLGLSIVRAIVERHHGTIEVSNPPGGGAVFEIRLPRPVESGGTTAPEERGRI